MTSQEKLEFEKIFELKQALEFGILSIKMLKKNYLLATKFNDKRGENVVLTYLGETRDDVVHVSERIIKYLDSSDKFFKENYN